MVAGPGEDRRPRRKSPLRWIRGLADEPRQGWRPREDRPSQDPGRLPRFDVARADGDKPLEVPIAVDGDGDALTACEADFVRKAPICRGRADDLALVLEAS